MNVVFPAFCIVVAGAAGYLLEPQLEDTLLLRAPKVAVVETESPKPVEKTPVKKPEPEVVVNTPKAPPVTIAPDPAPPADPTPAPASQETTAKNDPPAPAGNGGGGNEIEPPPAGVDDLIPPPPPLGDLGGGDSSKGDAVVELMKESLRDRQISEFKIDDVIGWKAGGQETFDGESYQVGLAVYRAKTIFGDKNLEAKALIQKGKIVKWIWSKSKLEIK